MLFRLLRFAAPHPDGTESMPRIYESPLKKSERAAIKRSLSTYVTKNLHYFIVANSNSQQCSITHSQHVIEMMFARELACLATNVFIWLKTNFSVLLK